MAKIINLNKVRKARNRAEKDVSAAANREKFGRSKARRNAEDAQAGRTDRDLDGKKLEDRDSD